jgi:stress response protein YsnF
VGRGKNGWCGTVLPSAPPPRSDPPHVRVHLESGEHDLVPAAVVIRQQDGSVSVRVDELVPTPCEEPAEILSAVVPVLAEEREVQKRRVETGTVRLTKVVHEREVQVNEPLWREKSRSHVCRGSGWWRVPCPCVRSMARQFSPYVEEVLVVEKRWMLREEIHSRQQRMETHQPPQITLRSEDVQVERVAHTDEEQ